MAEIDEIDMGTIPVDVSPDEVAAMIKEIEEHLDWLKRVAIPHYIEVFSE